MKRPKKSHLISTTLNNIKTTWKILSKFCGLTISELYKECELKKGFTPLSVSSMMQWLNDFFSLLYFWPTSKIAKSCLLICTWLNENIKCQTCEHSLKMYWSNSSKDNQLIFMKEIWRIYWFNLSSISLGLNHFRLQIKLEVAFS